MTLIYKCKRTAEKINHWDLVSIQHLKNLIAELTELCRDDDNPIELVSFIDTAALPSAEIPDDIDTSYPVWSIDKSGMMLVGEQMDEIINLADYYVHN